MRHYCVILQFFCLIAFNFYEAFGAEDFDGTAFCKGKGAGVYPDVPSNCTHFYVCEENVKLSMHWFCLPGTRFDTKTCICQASESVYCPVDLVDDVTDCSLSTKAPALVSKSQTNKPELNLTLTANGRSCDGKDTGLYPNVESGCHTYYACVKGVSHVYDYTCPKYYTFDHGHCHCLPAHVTHCKTSSTPCFPSPPPPAPTTTLPPPPPPSDFCRGKGPGYYTDVNRGCEWFFVCFGGNFQTYQFQCPSHLRFNHFTCNCDYPYAVTCTIFNEVPCFPPQNSKALL